MIFLTTRDIPTQLNKAEIHTVVISKPSEPVESHKTDAVDVEESSVISQNQNPVGSARSKTCNQEKESVLYWRKGSRRRSSSEQQSSLQ